MIKAYYVLGGYWRSSTRFGFATYRGWYMSGYHNYALGLRLVRNT